MAYLSFKPTDYFSTKLYTGNGTDDRAYTGVGFTPDFGWFKERSGTDVNFLVNTVMGANHAVYSNSNAVDDTSVNAVKAFGADGYTLGVNSGVNENSSTYVNWNWKAGTTSGISGGTITPSAYSINTTSGFGIYKYAGTGSNGTIAHGLSSAPKMVICKRIAGDTGDWNSWHSGLTSGAYYINLNTTGAQVSNSAVWNSTIPSSTVVSLGTYAAVNASGSTYIMFAWSEIPGYSSFGQYVGNGNVDGTFIYTGFRPNMVIIKNTSGQNWNLLDAVRNPSNVANKTFTPDTTAAEAVNGTGAGDKKIDILSNGFKIRTNSNELNQSGVNHIYMAWAEQPIVGSNGTAGVAR